MYAYARVYLYAHKFNLNSKLDHLINVQIYLSFKLNDEYLFEVFVRFFKTIIGYQYKATFYQN